MIHPYDIHYVKREDLDTDRWDHCIDQAGNGLIYGYSFYLDHMAKNWDALVLNDYEAVMPLTWNKKWGIKYLYQPPLTQQLGIFSSAFISEKIINLFLQEINKTFNFASILFNYDNYSPGFQVCHNYILPLNHPYDFLYSYFKADLQKNLKRAERFQISYFKTYDLKKALLHHQEKYKQRTPHVRDADYIHFENLCLQMKKKDEILTRAVLDTQDELLAVVVMFQRKNRIYLIESTTFDKGRQMQANHFLLDAIIQEFSGKNLILDFVGSNIPGIAHFYKNFGAADQNYFHYALNKLPWPFRLLK